MEDKLYNQKLARLLYELNGVSNVIGPTMGRRKITCLDCGKKTMNIYIVFFGKICKPCGDVFKKNLPQIREWQEGVLDKLPTDVKGFSNFMNKLPPIPRFNK